MLVDGRRGRVVQLYRCITEVETAGFKKQWGRGGWGRKCDLSGDQGWDLQLAKCEGHDLELAKSQDQDLDG